MSDSHISIKLNNIVKTYNHGGMRAIFRAISEKIGEQWYETRFDLDCRGRIEIEDLNKSVNDV